MTVNDVKEILGATLVCGETELNKEVHTACGADMMSDVLAFVKEQSILLTGLCNLQTIRTAELMDIICIVFVRGKNPDALMIDLAKANGIVLLTTGHQMFAACGMLYEKGLHGGAPHE